jgi:hypothetical protein
MERRERRVVENETKFRLVNERVRAVVREDPRDGGEHAERIVVACECGHEDCTEMIDVTTDTYEWTRSSPMRFVLAAGHELPEFERIVRDDGSYLVVEKFGDARIVASDSDPNS